MPEPSCTDKVLDVVTVPDFQPAVAAKFEARTLFFLASWLERAGAYARAAFHLHLVCIGEPPRSVRGLAELCGAEISVHPPWRINRGHSSNKLRGLAATRRSGRLLLVDCDLLVLGDLADLPEAVPAHAFASAPADRCRISDAYWEIIYDALKLPRPTARVLDLHAELGLEEARPMYPYSNAGILLLGHPADLLGLWEHDIAAIHALFREQAAARWTLELNPVTASDQAGLATALHRLALAGRLVCRLPDRFHYRPTHFAGGALPFAEIRLYHAIEFFRGLKVRTKIEEEMEAYIQKWTAEIHAGWARKATPDPEREQSEADHAASFLRDLWRQHVKPALAADD